MSTTSPPTYQHGGTPAPEPWSAATQAAHARSEYTPRATHYDSANQGWHDVLAADFVSALHPLPPAAAVLDLACGTGLVTYRLARAVGPDGLVVGADITPAMLELARTKLSTLEPDASPVELFEADVTDPAALRELEPVRRVLRSRGGFDVITCCSALVLLPDPQKCLEAWRDLLRKPGPDGEGGRLIVDVPTETWTTQYMAFELVGKEIGMPGRFNRGWVTDAKSLVGVMEGAGLEVERSWKSGNYLEGVCRVWDADEALTYFDAEVATKYTKMYPGEKMGEARKVWPTLWKKALGEDGKLRDGHWLYIAIARRV